MTERLDSLGEAWRDALRAARHPYLTIFLTAVVLRLLFLWIGSSQTASFPEWTGLLPDSRLYATSASAFAKDLNWNTQGVQVYGPGYPAVLAIWGALTSHHPASLLVCQVVTAAVGAVLLSVLAFRLTRDRAVATVAGLIHAASLAAISLACALLSDSVFLVVLLAGFLQFERASHQESAMKAALSGLLLGSAVLMRSAGWVALLLLPWLVLHHARAASRGVWACLWHSRRTLGVAAGVMLALPLLWAWRNQAEYGVAYVSKAGAVAQIRMAAAFQQAADGTDPEVALAAIGDSIATRSAASTEPERVYFEEASGHFWRRLRQYPGAALRSYAHTLNEATHTDWGILLVQLPAWDAPIRDAMHWTQGNLLRYRTLALSCLGLILLVAAGRIRLALTLAVAYLLFAMAAGLSLWQGNRIFYPGQIAWTVLSAVVLVKLGRGVPRLARLLRGGVNVV